MMKSPSMNGNKSPFRHFPHTHSTESILLDWQEQCLPDSNFSSFTKQNPKKSIPSCLSPKQRSTAICIKSKLKKNPFQRLDQNITEKTLPSVNTLLNEKNLEFGVNDNDLPSSTELQLAFTMSL